MGDHRLDHCHHECTRRRAAARLGWVLFCAATLGCRAAQTQPDEAAACKERSAILQARLAERERQLMLVRQELKSLRETQARAKAMGKSGEVEDFPVRGVSLGRFTGGKNLDGRPGDDAVRVYLFPVDREGDTVKRVGAVTVRLFDLALEDRSPLIGLWRFSPADAIQYWRSNPLFYGYLFELPWQAVVPTHRDLELRVEFVGLDGRPHAATRQFQIELPGPGVR